LIDASYYKYTSYYKYIGGKFFAAWLAVVPARAGLLVVGCWRGPCWHVFRSAGLLAGRGLWGWLWGFCLFVAGCFHLGPFCGLCLAGVDSGPQPAQNASTGRLWPFFGYCAGGVAGWLAVALWFVR